MHSKKLEGSITGKVQKMVKIVVVAHNVSVPLYKHRSKEFSSRTYFLAKRFDEIHLVSKEKFDTKTLVVKDETAPNIIIHRISSGIVKSNVEISRIARSVKGDLVFADCIWHGPSCLLCRRKDHIPFVVFAQTFISEQRAITLKLKLGMNPTPGLLSRVFALPDSMVLRNSDETLCGSNSLVEYAETLLPQRQWNKIKLVPYSIEYVKYIPQDSMLWADNVIESVKIKHSQVAIPIAHIGARPDKGTDIALKALKRIVKEVPNAVMLLVGKVIDPRYVKMAMELGLKDNTMFIEKAPRKHTLALLSRCSMLLLPSLTEGYGLALAEAMALGVPVITYENKPMKLAASRGAVIGIRTTDPTYYAKEVMSLLKNEEQRQSLIEKAKRYIIPHVDFSEQERLELISDYLDDLLKGS